MITAEQLEAVTQQVERLGASEETLAQLRRDFSGIHFTYCQDEDIGVAHPVVTRTGFNLYLIDSRNHCLAFTREAEYATGIVMAECLPECEAV